MQVKNNTSAFSTWTNYTFSLGATQKSMGRLSTGKFGAADDPAGLGISQRLYSQVSAVDVSIRNLDNGISLAQTADSWMQNVGSMLSRMKSLSIENGGIASTTDKTNIQTDFKAMQDAIKSITTGPTASAQFNGLYLLRGGNGQPTPVGGGVEGGAMEVQAGPEVNQKLGLDLSNLDATNKAVIGTVNTYTYNDQNSLVGSSHTAVTWNDVMTMSAGTPNATGMLDVAIDYVANARASMGAQQGRLESTQGGLMSYADNLQAAAGKISDVDMARESSNYAMNLILLRSGTAMLSQANGLPAYALKLLA